MKSETIKQWWPLGQSLDLVRAETEVVAKAVKSEVQRFVNSRPINMEKVAFACLASVFGSVPVFTNVPTILFTLPTRSEWTVIWNNSSLCNGYNSLCKCLTINHGLDTLHWISHDDDTTFQAGSSFTFRSQTGDISKERSVYVGKNDRNWMFYASGTALPEEDLSWYEVPTKSERLNERLLMELLSRVGATPWSEEWYDFRKPCFQIIRTEYPDTVTKCSVGEIIGRTS